MYRYFDSQRHDIYLPFLAVFELVFVQQFAPRPYGVMGLVLVLGVNMADVIVFLLEAEYKVLTLSPSFFTQLQLFAERQTILNIYTLL